MSTVEQKFIIDPLENNNYKEFLIERRPILKEDFSIIEKHPFKESLISDKFIIKDNKFNNKYIDFNKRSNQDLDSLITELFRVPINIPERNTPAFPRIRTIIDTAVRPAAEPAQPVLKKSFRSDGFSAVEGFLKYTNITVNGEAVFSAEGKTNYTHIDFTPSGRGRFIRSKITDSIAKGISGLVKYLSALDMGEIEAAPLLIGNTNLNMALICQRIGFSITDDCKTETGEIDRDKGSYTVIGKIEDIREKVAEFQRKGTMERIQERQARLQRRQEPVMFPSLA